MYWQLNKGWPSLLWNVDNQDGDQAGSYYGVQEANQTLHALYALDNGTVTLDNLGGTTQSGLSIESKVYNTSGSVLDDQTASGISLSAQRVANKVLTPKVPATVTSKSSASTYFVELTLRQSGNVVDRNVYWESTYPDKVNWTKTLNGENANSYATMSQYANLQGLNSIAAGSVSAGNVTTTSVSGPDGSDTATNVTLTNTSSKTVGFFLRTDLRRADTNAQVPSALWSDNDITLFPGESETVTVTYKASDLSGTTPTISLSGWNVAAASITG
jgi:exo-1,4-beta-D-glucosaminidase